MRECLRERRTGLPCDERRSCYFVWPVGCGVGTLDLHTHIIRLSCRLGHMLSFRPGSLGRCPSAIRRLAPPSRVGAPIRRFVRQSRRSSMGEGPPSVCPSVAPHAGAGIARSALVVSAIRCVTRPCSGSAHAARHADLGSRAVALWCLEAVCLLDPQPPLLRLHEQLQLGRARAPGSQQPTDGMGAGTAAGSGEGVVGARRWMGGTRS